MLPCTVYHHCSRDTKVMCVNLGSQHQQCWLDTHTETRAFNMGSSCWYVCVCVHLCTGEKLSESTAGDVRELCTTLLNCYLIQLLETGFLHADPHPGNLIRTPEGQICILDFGLMTEVSPCLSKANLHVASVYTLLKHQSTCSSTVHAKLEGKYVQCFLNSQGAHSPA